MSGLVSFFRESFGRQRRSAGTAADGAADGGSFAESGATQTNHGTKQATTTTTEDTFKSDSPVKYNDWSNQQKEWINEFMNERIVMKYGDQYQDYDGKTMKRVVPHHMLHTRDTATRFAEINLKAKHFELGKLQVRRVWNLRQARRPAVVEVEPRRQVTHNAQPELCRMSLYPCQDDGPLAVLYSNVISMEVGQAPLTEQEQKQQLSQHDQQKMQLRRLTAAATSKPGAPDETRLTIFLYDQYASAMSTIVEFWKRREHQSHSLKIELLHVAPASVMPFGSDPSDWDSLSSATQYCLCFGATSQMKVRNEQNKVKRRRFDGTYDTNGNPIGGLLRIKVELVSDQDDNEKVVRAWEISSDHANFLKEIRPHAAAATATAPPRVGQQPNNNNKHGSSRKRANSSDKEEQQKSDAERPPKQQRGNKAPPGTARAGQQQRASGGSGEDQRGPNSRGSGGLGLVAASLGNQAVEAVHELPYCKLTDLASMLKQTPRGTSCIANLYCVVINIGSPSLSNGGDWCLSLGLIDDSLQTFDDDCHVVALNIFNRNLEGLPKAIRCGDVIRIHRARINEWNENIQLIGSKRAGASYMVYRPLEVTSPSKNCSVGKGDGEVMSQLWKWGQKRIRSGPTTKSEHLLTLAEIQNQSAEVAEGKDITAMVTRIFESGVQQGAPIAFLRIWDGTGASLNDPCPVENMATTLKKEGDPPSSAIAKLCNIISSDLRGEDLIEPDTVTGRVANVALWHPQMVDFAQSTLTPGSFVRLRNVKPDYVKIGDNEILCLNAHSKSSLTPLPNFTFEVLRLIRAHNTRLVRRDPFNAESGVRPLETPEGTNADIDIDANNVTNSLQGLVSRKAPGLCTGDVTILDSIPSLQDNSSKTIRDVFDKQGAMGLVLKEGDLKVEVLVERNGPCAGPVLKLLKERHVQDSMGKVSGLRSAISNRRVWSVNVLSTVMEGNMYFVLDSLQNGGIK